MKKVIDIDASADAVVALINARPSTPTRGEIVAALRTCIVGAVFAGERVLYPEVSRPFDQFEQVTGPPCAYNDMRDADGAVTQRCVYQAFGWRSNDLTKIAARVQGLVTQIKAAGGRTIVWRTDPQVEKQGDEYVFYCRLHILPYVQLSGFKPESEKVAEA